MAVERGSLWSVFDEFDDVVVATDESGQLRFCNDAAVEVSGYDRASLERMDVSTLLAAEGIVSVDGAVDDALRGGAATLEASIVTAAGGHRPHRFSVRSLPTEESASVVWIGKPDPTDSPDEPEGAILDRMSDGFIAVDTDWCVTDANEKGRAILAEAMGRDPATTFEGLELWAEIPDHEETTSYERYHHAMASGETVTFETFSPAVGSWFEVSAFPTDSGLSVYFQEVTEQRQKGEQLERQQRVLREIYEIISDPEASFTQQVQALLALGRAELDTAYGTLSKIEDGEYRFEYVDAEDDSIEAGDTVPLEATNCEIVASTEQTLVLGDVERDAPEQTHRAGYTEMGIACYIGAPVYVGEEIYGTFCFYDTKPRSGTFSEWERTLVDLISRWLSAELGRQEATADLQRQNERLERFAGVLSHDIRNPLTVAMGRTELLAEEIDSEDLQVVLTSLERIDALIEDTLALTRQGDVVTDTEPVSLSSVVDDCWEVVATETATLQMTGDLRFEAAPSQLQRLLENLIRNAIDHVADDVTISVGPLATGEGFYVADDGEGIPEADREAVFEIGHSSATDGTGFGLAIVREIADGHGWTVAVTESESGGARFEISGVETSA